MWKKRKPPYLLFFLFLLLCILTGYYFSGIFLEPGLALSNIPCQTGNPADGTDTGSGYKATPEKSL